MADVAGGIIGGLGSLLGGLSGIGGGVENFHESVTIDPSVNSDALTTAMSLDALMQLGDTTGIEAMLQSASPLQQQIDKIRATPFMSNDVKNKAIVHMRRQWEGQTNNEFKNEYGVARATANLDSNATSPAAREQWEQTSSQAIERIRSTGSQEARVQALQDLGRIAGNIGGIDAGRGSTTGDFFRNQADDQFEKDREQVLQNANAGGYNPGGILGELGAQRSRDHRDANMRGLELDMARLGGLEQFLQQGTTNAQNAAQIRQQGAISSAGISANQAQAVINARAGGQQTAGGQALGAVGNALTVGGLLGTSNRPGAGPASSAFSGGPTGGFGGGINQYAPLFNNSVGLPGLNGQDPRF